MCLGGPKVHTCSSRPLQLHIHQVGHLQAQCPKSLRVTPPIKKVLKPKEGKKTWRCLPRLKKKILIWGKKHRDRMLLMTKIKGWKRFFTCHWKLLLISQTLILSLFLQMKRLSFQWIPILCWVFQLSSPSLIT